jgi:hypothetical protein
VINYGFTKEIGASIEEAIIKPTMAMKMIGNSELEPVASAIEKKLNHVFDAII